MSIVQYRSLKHRTASGGTTTGVATGRHSGIPRFWKPTQVQMKELVQVQMEKPWSKHSIQRQRIPSDLIQQVCS